MAAAILVVNAVTMMVVLVVTLLPGVNDEGSGHGGSAGECHVGTCGFSGCEGADVGQVGKGGHSKICSVV